MGSTAGSSAGLPRPGHDLRAARGVARRLTGIAAIAICAFVAFIAFGTAVLDTGPYGLPALALAVSALALAIVFVRRGRATLALMVALVSVPTVLAATLAGAAVGEGNACSDRERQALAQIAHLGGVRPGIAGDLQTGGCIVRYTTAAEPAAVLPHYETSLSAAGWLLTAIRPNGPDRTSGDLNAVRGRFSIWVSWWSASGATTRVVVSLND